MSPTHAPQNGSKTLPDTTVLVTGGTDVGVAVVKPGLVDTDIRKKQAPWFIRLIDYVLWFQRRTAEEVAETPAHLAVDAAHEAMNGRFFGPEGDEIDVPDVLQDPALRDRLWSASERLVAEALEDTPAEPVASTSLAVSMKLPPDHGVLVRLQGAGVVSGRAEGSSAVGAFTIDQTYSCASMISLVMSPSTLSTNASATVAAGRQWGSP